MTRFLLIPLCAAGAVSAFGQALDNTLPEAGHADLVGPPAVPRLAADARPIVQFSHMHRGLPVYLATDNADAADTVGADELHPGGSTGLGLDGSGVELGIWDGGGVSLTHQELVGKASHGDSPFGITWHGTHVATTMAGIGAWPGDPNDPTYPPGASLGMSPGATILSFDWNSDDTEMDTAAAGGLRISNHSYGFITGWRYGDFGEGDAWYWFGDPNVDAFEDYNFGFYSFKSAAWDQIAHDHPQYLICKSAGNDRNDDPGAGTGHYYYDGNDWVFSTETRKGDGDYDSISHAGIAKNILTVAAIDDVNGGYSGPGSVAMSSFSGWGPADDGRIKPDISANGIQLLSAYTASDSSYAIASGTSMSTPNTSGTLGLLLQHWRNTHAGDPRSATLKGIVLHTADECGANPGPDYEFGWGLLDAVGAAEVMTADVTAPLTVQERTLADGGSYTLYATTVGGEPLRATLCWTDPAAASPAASLDPPTPMLVNDLDLRVVEDDGPGTYLPWRLDRLNPSAAATTGDNTVDNVEQVLVASPGAQTYRIEVSHKGSLGGGQAYSLIVSGAVLSAGGPCGSDIDGSGAVDLSDLATLLANFGASGATLAQGDINGDGNVDLSDLAELLSNFGVVC